MSISPHLHHTYIHTYTHTYIHTYTHTSLTTPYILFKIAGMKNLRKILEKETKETSLKILPSPAGAAGGLVQEVPQDFNEQLSIEDALREVKEQIEKPTRKN